MLVDGFPLLVHDIVILEEVFANVEVVRFNLLLRILDLPASHRDVDWNTLLHAQLQHDSEIRSEAKMRMRSSPSER